MCTDTTVRCLCACAFVSDVDCLPLCKAVNKRRSLIIYTRTISLQNIDMDNNCGRPTYFPVYASFQLAVCPVSNCQ